MDRYEVGGSRGCGGTGVWDGQKLYVGRNYKTWRVIANGPIRAIFELTYDTWDTAGGSVGGAKPFPLDAAHNHHQVADTFLANTPPKETTPAIPSYQHIIPHAP